MPSFAAHPGIRDGLHFLSFPQSSKNHADPHFYIVRSRSGFDVILWRMPQNEVTIPSCRGVEGGGWSTFLRQHNPLFTQ